MQTACCCPIPSVRCSWTVLAENHVWALFSPVSCHIQLLYISTFGGEKMLMSQSFWPKKKKRGVPDLVELQMLTAGTAADRRTAAAIWAYRESGTLKSCQWTRKGPNWSPSVGCNIIESLIAGAYRCGKIPGHPPTTAECAVVGRIKAHNWQLLICKRNLKCECNYGVKSHEMTRGSRDPVQVY